MDGEGRVEIVRAAYRAWNAQDLEAGLALMANEAEWRPPPDSPFAGPHRGQAAIGRFFRSMLEAFEEFRRSAAAIELHGIHVLVEVSSYVRGRGSGAGVEVRLFDVFTIPEDLVTAYAVFATRREALEWIQAHTERLEAPAPGKL